MTSNFDKFTEELEKDRKAGRTDMCPLGGDDPHPLGYHPDERNGFVVDGKQVCEDCYFKSWGKEIDEHPIGVPHRRGPMT